MADYEIFREQLAIKYASYGYALWEPSPTNPNRPVQVGDVGFIREGRFHRLFSAMLPADHPSQEFGVPENHEPLVPTLSDHVTTSSLSRNHYCSFGVKVEADPGYYQSSPDDFSQVLFRNVTTRAAAVLSLPVMARHENTLLQVVFGRWMVKHVGPWFVFARNLGLVHKMEEIILVTGCDLTRSWTNVAFLGGADTQVSFGVKVSEGPNTSINFQFLPEHAGEAMLRHGPEGTNLPENQCVFIRGFRVAPSLWILPKRLKAAAGPSSDPGYDNDSDMEVISIPAITQFRDPLHILSDYIAEQASDCDKILVHDEDLLMIDPIGHGTLLDTLRKSNITIHKFECEKDSFPTESHSGPNTDTSNNVKVATLSMKFQNWPLPQKIDLSHTNESPVALRSIIPPPPPPLSSFPTPHPYVWPRSTDHKQNVADNSTYFRPSPLAGNNHFAPMHSSSTHTSQPFTYSPMPPHPVRKSTRPHSNVTAPAPAPPPTHAFTTLPAPPYEYALPSLISETSDSTSYGSSFSDLGPSTPAEHPFTAAGTNASGPRPPQRFMTVPVPILPDTTASAPYDSGSYHSGSSPPNIVKSPPQSVMSGESPPNNTQDWSYLNLQVRDHVSGDSGDEDSVQSPDGMSNSSGYMGQKGPQNPPYASRRRQPRRRETVPANSSQAQPELEKCRLCQLQGPRHEWASLGHGGFCSENHKWQWEGYGNSYAKYDA